MLIDCGRREPLIGYWVATDNPVATERIASLGYDYVCLDMQHGLIGYAGMLANVMATDAGGSSSVVRVGANDAGPDRASPRCRRARRDRPAREHRRRGSGAVAACRYQPGGIRSFGPSRAPLRVGGGDVASVDPRGRVHRDDRDRGRSGQRRSDLRDSGSRRRLHRPVRPLDRARCAACGSGGRPPGLRRGPRRRPGGRQAGWDRLWDAHHRRRHCRAPPGRRLHFASISSDLLHLQAAARAHLSLRVLEGRAPSTRRYTRSRYSLRFSGSWSVRGRVGIAPRTGW